MGWAFAGLGVALVGTTLVGLVVLAPSLARMVASAADGSVPSSAELTGDLYANGPFLVASTLGLWLGFVGVPAAVTRWRGARSFAADFGWSLRWSDVWLGVVAGAALIGVGQLFTAVASATGADLSDADNAAFLAQLPAVWKVVMVAVTVVGAPLVEELFFRGLMLRGAFKTARRRLGARSSAVVAVAGSSLVFGVMHVPAASAGGLLLFAVTGTFGVVLAVLAVVTGRLGAGIVAHVCVNAVGAAAAVWAW